MYVNGNGVCAKLPLWCTKSPPLNYRIQICKKMWEKFVSLMENPEFCVGKQ